MLYCMLTKLTVNLKLLHSDFQSNHCFILANSSELKDVKGSLSIVSLDVQMIDYTKSWR